jgi:hypothetical protein
MTVDDFLKIILILAIVFAIAGISFQIMRLLSKFTDILEDSRHSIANVNKLSDMALEDYEIIRNIIRDLSQSIESVKEFAKNPMKLVSDFLSILKSLGGLINRREKSTKQP